MGGAGAAAVTAVGTGVGAGVGYAASNKFTKEKEDFWSYHKPLLYKKKV